MEKKRSFREKWKWYWWITRMDYNYLMVEKIVEGGKMPPFWVWWFFCDLPRFILLTIWFFLMAQICKYKGHDWVDESYGNPESGCMAGYCKRCHFSFHHTLY